MARRKPLVLTILDGWGVRAETHGNAIAQARKPNYDLLLQQYPNTILRASEHFVGLPDGQMGNSEVGHVNLGAGRVVRMDISRIDQLVDSGQLFELPVLVDAVRAALERGRAIHLLGLVSDGGVHSHQRHLYALLKLCAQQGASRVFVHAFLDGRDTMPTSGAGYIQALQQQMRTIGVGQIASCSGRYFAMDRDLKWDRERKAFDAMVRGIAEGPGFARITPTASRTNSSFPLSAPMPQTTPSQPLRTRTSAFVSTIVPTGYGRLPGSWPAPSMADSPAVTRSTCRRQKISTWKSRESLRPKTSATSP